MIAWEQQPTRDLYALLWAYYCNNSLYEVLREAAIEAGALTTETDLKSLRNPANRAVEFYAAKVWPGVSEQTLAIESDNGNLAEAVNQVWRWSNWDVRKQRLVRWFAAYGEMFIKVAATPGSPAPLLSSDIVASNASIKRVHFQVLDPAWVSEYTEDERGFLTWLRMDYPIILQNDDGNKKPGYHTEIWSKPDNTYMAWDHQKGLDAKVSQLGDPDSQNPITMWGIDFIPIVSGHFRDVGGDGERGNGCFTHVLDKIDEANRLATMLHSRLFRYNRPDKALVGVGADAVGRPLPPPVLEGDDDGLTIEYGEEKFYRLPSGWQIQNLVAPIAWDAALSTLQDHMLELERDLPELLYWRLAEAKDLSGKAIRMMMSGAIDRLLEVRANAEAALIRADQMALTIAINGGLFSDLGTFENGDFEHHFAERDAIPVSEQEKAETLKILSDAQVPILIAAKHAGWSEEQILELDAAKKAADAEAKANLAASVAQFQGAMSQGDNLNPDAQSAVTSDASGSFGK